MTPIELKICDIQGRLFKLSALRGINSAEFIKVFMKSATAKALDSTYNRMQWAGEEYLLEEVIEILKEADRICLRQEVAMLGCLADKALICGLKWSASWCLSSWVK